MDAYNLAIEKLDSICESALLDCELETITEAAGDKSSKLQNKLKMAWAAIKHIFRLIRIAMQSFGKRIDDIFIGNREIELKAGFPKCIIKPQIIKVIVNQYANAINNNEKSDIEYLADALKAELSEKCNTNMAVTFSEFNSAWRILSYAAEKLTSIADKESLKDHDTSFIDDLRMISVDFNGIINFITARFEHNLVSEVTKNKKENDHNSDSSSSSKKDEPKKEKDNPNTYISSFGGRHVERMEKVKQAADRVDSTMKDVSKTQQEIVKKFNEFDELFDSIFL